MPDDGIRKSNLCALFEKIIAAHKEGIGMSNISVSKGRKRSDVVEQPSVSAIAHTEVVKALQRAVNRILVLENEIHYHQFNQKAQLLTSDHLLHSDPDAELM